VRKEKKRERGEDEVKAGRRGEEKGK